MPRSRPEGKQERVVNVSISRAERREVGESREQEVERECREWQVLKEANGGRT